MSPPIVEDLDIRTRVLTALRWAMTSRLLGQLLSWAVTLYVIRILSPEDYGLMAMASVPAAFFYLLNTAGLDAVLVQRTELSEKLRAQIFGAVIVLNLLFFLVFLGAAPWIAAFYHQPRLTAIIRVLGFQFVLLIFETLPQSQLERDLNFKRRSIVELVAIITGSLATLALACAGFGVWTLVWGSLATTAIRIAGLNLIQSSWRRPSFYFRGMRSDLRFGRAVTVDRAVRFSLADTDRLIGGKLFGDTSLGYYAVANDLASLPIHKLTGLINSIALPAFAKVQPREVGTSFLAANRMVSFLAFPVFLGISSVAGELTALLLGPKWEMVAVPLQLLSIIMPLRMILNTFQPFLWGIGRPDRSVSTFLIGALIMPVAFFVGAHWGPVGLSLVWVLVYPVVFLISIAHTQSQTGVSLIDLLLAIARPALASAVMYTAVAAAKGHAFIGQSGDVVYLAQLILVAMAVYTGSMLLVDRHMMRDVAELIRVFLGRHPKPA